MRKLKNFLTLFTSFSTLICCALPALLVSLGLGATLSSLVSTFPQITWISEHKDFVFIVAGILLGLSILYEYKAQEIACPTDPELSEVCRTSKKVSKIIITISILIYLVGTFFAYLLPMMWS